MLKSVKSLKISAVVASLMLLVMLAITLYTNMSAHAAGALSFNLKVGTPSSNRNIGLTMQIHADFKPAFAEVLVARRPDMSDATHFQAYDWKKATDETLAPEAQLLDSKDAGCYYRGMLLTWVVAIQLSATLIAFIWMLRETLLVIQRCVRPL